MVMRYRLQDARVQSALPHHPRTSKEPTQMKHWKHTSWTLALCVLGGLATVANAQDEQANRMKTALASPQRPQADKDRDAARKPIETIQFLGIKSGQTVM